MRPKFVRAVFLALVALVLVGCGGGSEGASANTTTSNHVPYSDPNAVGYIGLCNQAGKQITSGSINTVPFAWRAVSSVAAPPPYNNDWRTAILIAYQPIEGIPAGEWSGDELTASARYTNPEHPMAAATGGDDSLADFLQEYHPRWDGFLQLRMYLGTKDAAVYSLHYPELAIQVTGDAWHAVGGGTVNCHSGTAESIESILLPKSKTTVPTTTSPGSATGGTKAASGSGPRGSDPTGGSAGSANGKDPGPSSNPRGSSAANGSGSGLAASSPASTNHAPVLVVVLVALAALAASGAILFRRRRLATNDLHLSATNRRSPTKGP